MTTRTMTRAALGALMVALAATPSEAQYARVMGERVEDQYAEMVRAAAVESGEAFRELAQALPVVRAAGAGYAMGLQRLRFDLAAVGHEARAMGASRARTARVPMAGLPVPPASWDAQDPADSLYRAARRDLNDRKYRDAARKYAQLRADYPSSTYVGDAYYWEAQARFRMGGNESLSQAMELIELQRQRHPDAATREDARALMVRIQSQQARRGDAAAAQQLARNAASNCDEEEDQIRAAALNALLQMDSDRAAPILREVLADRDECSAELREQAIFLLAQNPTDETVRTLVDLALNDPDPDEDVREAAVFWLSQVRTEEALDALLGILESGEADLGIREQAIYAVSQHRSERVTQLLRDYVEDAGAPTELRENAIFWLGQRDGGATYLRGLYDSVGPALREQILFAVAQERTDASRDWLMARALDESESTEVRKNALFWAGEAGVQMAEVLRVYQTADDEELREQAIFVLSQEKTTEAVDALMRIAREEENPELKENAIFWLGQSRDPRVAEFLLELIRGGGGL